MAVSTKAQIMESLKSLLGNNTSDEAIKIVEDVEDTIGDFETKSKDKTDWKSKYEENDKSWREKYRNRFFGSDNDKEEEDKQNSRFNNDDQFDDLKRRNYEDLFKEDK